MSDDAATMSATSKADVTAVVAGFVTVTLWGSAFVGIRAVGEALAPGPLALGRLLVSCAILGAVALVRREPLPRRSDLLAIAAFGVLWLGCYSVTLNAAERFVDAGTAAMIINTGPILIVILAGIFLREGFPRGLFAGCAIALGGCAMIGLAAISSGSRSGLGITLCIVAALAYAVAVIVQKPVLTRVSPFQVTWLGCAAATLTCMPFAPALVAQTAKAGPSAIGWTIYLGAVPTAFGFATWAFALRQGSAGRTGALTYLIPVVAVSLGWLVLGERPPWLAVAGGALCLGGVYVARRPTATD
jgi:drug/metabolite transporter (DMT)-like permease